MVLRELTNDEFNKFTANYLDYSIYQTKEYGLAANHQYNASFFVGLVNNNNQIVAGSLIVIKEISKLKYAYAPRGFLIDYNDYSLLEEFTKLLKTFLKKKGVISITISPLIWCNKYSFNGKMITKDTNSKHQNAINNLEKLKYHKIESNNLTELSKYDAILNINRNIVATFMDIRKNYRNKIRSSDAKGVRIYKGNELQIPFIYEQLKTKKETNQTYIENIYHFFSQKNMADLHFAVLEPSLYLRYVQVNYQKQSIECRKRTDLVFKNQGKNNEHLVAKKIEADKKLEKIKKDLISATNILKNYPNGVITACAITIKHRDCVYLYLDSFDFKYKSFNSRQLLIWKLIDKYTKEGYKVFNLGPMINPLDLNNEDSGINHSKLSFGAECLEYIGNFELVINTPLYTIAKKNVR